MHLTRARNPMAPREQEQPKPEAPDVYDELMGGTIAFYGPASPPLLYGAEEFTPSWRTQELSLHGSLGVLGLHGGAGATTVAHLMGDEAIEVGREWPRPAPAAWGMPAAEATGAVLAVARDDYRGLNAADVFLKAWAAGNLPGPRLLGLVLVASSPHLTTPRAHESKRLLHISPLGVRLPWLGMWLEGLPDTDTLPRRVKQTVKTIKKSLAPKEK